MYCSFTEGWTSTQPAEKGRGEEQHKQATNERTNHRTTQATTTTTTIPLVTTMFDAWPYFTLYFDPVEPLQQQQQQQQQQQMRFVLPQLKDSVDVPFDEDGGDQHRQAVDNDGFLVPPSQSTETHRRPMPMAPILVEKAHIRALPSMSVKVMVYNQASLRTTEVIQEWEDNQYDVDNDDGSRTSTVGTSVNGVDSVGEYNSKVVDATGFGQKEEDAVVVDSFVGENM